MPTGTGYRGSTQDSSGGVQVAQATGEVSGAGILAVGVTEGNKTTYSNQSRTGQTGTDAATSDLSTSGFAGSAGANLFDIGNALACVLRASCSVASASLAGRLIYYDGSNNPIGMSEPITFISDAARRLAAAGDYICQHFIVDVGEARKARFYIENISSGTWAVIARPV
jgi:hypothetical protein